MLAGVMDPPFGIEKTLIKLSRKDAAVQEITGETRGNGHAYNNDRRQGKFGKAFKHNKNPPLSDRRAGQGALRRCKIRTGRPSGPVSTLQKRKNSRCLREFDFKYKTYASHARIIVQVEGFNSQP